MKKSTILTILMSMLFYSGDLSAQTGSFEYCSPVPGSRMVSTGTSIILRSKGLLDGQTPVTAAIVSVSGSMSGEHVVHAVLSDDDRTMIFQPERPFLFGEDITVSYHAGIRTRAGEGLPPFTFSFTTQSHKIPFASQLVSMDDYPPNRPSGVKTSSNRFTRTIATGDILPPDFPPLTFTAYRPVPSRQMYIDNFTNASGIGFYLIDVATTGDVLKYKSTPYTLDFKKQSNGLLSYYDIGASGFIVMDSAYHTLDTCRTVGYSTDWHDFLMLDNGHLLLLGDDPETVGMDTIVPGGRPFATVDGIIIQELDQNKNVVFQWRSWDHFNITDAIGINLTAQIIDYVHSNAIDFDYDGNILLSSRHLSEITKIDRNTGDIIWRWGGKNNQFTFIGDTLQFTYQHAIRRIKNGHYTLFDNGNLHTPHFSRAMEYQLDQDGKTATAVWEYRNAPDIYGSATGYVQRMDDGNTLICWGATNPNVSLIAPDSSKIFDLTMPNGIWTYRAYMYPYAPPVLAVSPPAETLGVKSGSLQQDSLTLVNLTTGDVPYLVSNHQPWLHPGSLTGSVTASDSLRFGFTVNASGFLVGNIYRDTLTFYGFDTLHSAIQIPVMVQATGPKILVYPMSISSTTDSGRTARDSLKILNAGSFPLICGLSSSDTSAQSWFIFSGDVDTLAPGDSVIRRLQINAQALLPGSYTTNVTVISSDSLTGNLLIPVSLQVLPLRTVLVSVSPEWNLVSLPVLPVSTPPILAAGSSGAYMYTHSYILADSLNPGRGYWLKFDSAQTLPVTGAWLTTGNLAVNSGWNIVGSISLPVAASSITSEPPGIQTSPFYSYNGTYSGVDSIFPGKGYWVKVNRDGILTMASGSSAVSQNRIRIVTNSERPPGPPGGYPSKNGQLPVEYALEEAYPSPFNPSTTIRYALPFESKVSLKVYSLLGQEVETLRDGIEDAGVRSITWDAGKYAGGVYFYRLITTKVGNPPETFLQIRKMVLMK